MPLVVDASVLLRWYFEDEDELAPQLFRAVVRDSLVVPTHWRAELANGVVVGERRGRSRPEQMAQMLQLIDRLDLTVDERGGEAALSLILPLARAHRLTVYDALYLELAERRGLPLATFDVELASAARSVGIDVLDQESQF